MAGGWTGRRAIAYRRPVKTSFLSGVLAAIMLASCATPPPPAPVASAIAAPAARDEAPFVITANPLAARAGMEVLERGGSAADAAVAIQAMLSLVEPQSSGVGGGAFMTWFDGRSHQVMVYDGREAAPARATPAMFLDRAGQPLPFASAVLSGRSTGVPGAVALLALAQHEHGTLPWNSLFASAERTAHDGFAVSPRLARLIAGPFPQASAPDAVAYFHKPDGTRMTVGDTLTNPAYANFLHRLADQGPAALYSGSTAAKIVARTHDGALPGAMTMADLAAYRPVKRAALCRPWRAYHVCAPPPPASGVGMLELLGLLEQTDIAARGPADPQAWFTFAEASRLMYADRDQYVGDPAFVEVPVDGLLDRHYLAERAGLIGSSAMPTPAAGTPAGARKMAADHSREPVGTSHFIVRDAAGNVVSMTTTVESIFGSGRMVDGFFLNNQLTDFSFSPTDHAGRPIANAVAPGKRPRSSMTPLILIDHHGRFAGAIGSAGGMSILAFVGKSLVAAVDWKLPMQLAIALPNLVGRGSSFKGEVSRFDPAILAAMTARGATIQPGDGEDSGVQGVLIRDDGSIDGGFDPRREGLVLVLRR